MYTGLTIFIWGGNFGIFRCSAESCAFCCIRQQTFWGSWPLPRPFICELNECFSWLKAVYSARNGAPKKPEELFLHPFMFKMKQPVPIKQPAKTAAICTACHDHACPTPPILPFLLAQNLSSKRIAPTATGICSQSCMTSTLIISG